jgi:hypothetical protein
MNKNFSYRQKNRLLIWGSLVFFIIVYFLSIRNTIALFKENGLLKRQIEVAQTAPEQIADLKAASGIFEKRFEALQNQENFKKQLLTHVGEICSQNKLILKGFSEAESFEDNGLIIENHVIDLQGNYHDLVKAVHELEQQSGAGRIVSARFNIERDRRTKKEFLVATLIIQTINRQDYENI